MGVSNFCQIANYKGDIIGKLYFYKILTKNRLVKGRNNDECIGILVQTFNKKTCKVAFYRMVIKDELPFVFVEGEGFIDFCAKHCPKFDTPSLNNYCKRCVSNLFRRETKTS